MKKNATDVLTPLQRSHCMSRIRGKNTKPELALRKALWAAGLRYRLHYKIAGTPDIALPRYRIAVFVDGCFFHGCPQHGTKPKNNADYWRTKIRKNKARDRRVSSELSSQGWKVLRYWEHDVRKNIEAVVASILEATSEPLRPSEVRRRRSGLPVKVSLTLSSSAAHRRLAIAGSLDRPCDRRRPLATEFRRPSVSPVRAAQRRSPS